MKRKRETGRHHAVLFCYEPWFVGPLSRLFAFCFYPEYHRKRFRVRLFYKRIKRILLLPLSVSRGKRFLRSLRWELRVAWLIFLCHFVWSLPLPVRQWMYRRGWLV